MLAIFGSFWFRAVLSGVVLVALVIEFDMSDTVDALLAVDVRYLAAAVVVDAAARGAMIVRWVVLLRSSGVMVEPGTVARIFFVSSFFGTVLPAGGADVTRAYALSRHTAGSGPAVASVAIDRLLGVTALMALGLIGLMVGPPLRESALRPLLAGGGVAVAGGAVAMLAADVLARTVLPDRLRRTAAGRWIEATAAALGRYRRRPGVLVAVLGQSVAVQVLRVLEVFLLGRGLGIALGLHYYVILMPLGLFAFMLPVSIAGIGVPQGVVVWLLRQADVPDAVSFALSTLVILLGVAGTLPGLYLHLASGEQIH